MKVISLDSVKKISGGIFYFEKPDSAVDGDFSSVNLFDLVKNGRISSKSYAKYGNGLIMYY